MSNSTLQVKQDGVVLRVTLSNPPINLMSIKMTEELFQLSGRLMFDPSVNVVVFDSADTDFFVAHFDLLDLASAGSDPSKAGKFPDINVLQSLSLNWQALPQVTIAKIDGRCRGGGLEFALGLSMRFATLDSKFCFPEASSGFLPSGGGTTRTALAAGPARALEVLLSSRDFSGEEAERYGLINRALPKADLDRYVDDLVSRIARRSRPTITMNREVINRVFAGMVDPVFAGFAAENDGLRAGMAGAEMPACMEAMLRGGQTRERELDLPATIAKDSAAK